MVKTKAATHLTSNRFSFSCTDLSLNACNAIIAAEKHTVSTLQNSVQAAILLERNLSHKQHTEESEDPRVTKSWCNTMHAGQALTAALGLGCSGQLQHKE